MLIVDQKQNMIINFNTLAEIYISSNNEIRCSLWKKVR